MDIRRLNSFTAIALKCMVVAMIMILSNYPSVVSAQVFPAAVQQRIDAGRYSTPSLVSQSALLDRYEVVDSNDGSLIHLLRYSIGSGSFYSQDNAQTPVAGAVWVLMRDEYAILDVAPIGFPPIDTPSRRMEVYTELINPDFFEYLNGLLQAEFEVFWRSDALLAGAGIQDTFVFNYEPDTDDFLSLGAIDCLSSECYTGAEFNLLGVRYIQSGDVANATFLPPSQALLNGQLLYSDNSRFLGDDFGNGPFRYTRSLVVNAVSEPLLGDCNQDGVVSFLDISPFISLLSIGDFLAEADINEDGFVSFLDIGPFITLLSN